MKGNGRSNRSSHTASSEPLMTDNDCLLYTEIVVHNKFDPMKWRESKEQAGFILAGCGAPASSLRLLASFSIQNILATWICWLANWEGREMFLGIELWNIWIDKVSLLNYVPHAPCVPYAPSCLSAFVPYSRALSTRIARFICAC